MSKLVWEEVNQCYNTCCPNKSVVLYTAREGHYALYKRQEHKKNSKEIWDEMCHTTDHSFLRFTTFGNTKQNLVFIVARCFLNSARCF